jgi:hypothetical protein
MIMVMRRRASGVGGQEVTKPATLMDDQIAVRFRSSAALTVML